MTNTLVLSQGEPHVPETSIQPVDRYQQQSVLAIGGMGMIEHVYDAVLQRHVALKTPRLDARDRRARSEELLREARLMALLEHPCVLPVYELVERGPDAARGFAMKLVRGQTLFEHLEQLGEERLKPHALRHSLSVLVTVCDAIAFAHQHAVLHLDLKADNIMLEGSEHVYVLDWGLAARCGRGKHGFLTALDIHRSARGTVSSMAPEQFSPSLAEVDDRTDVHGLGAVLCQILTGCPPYLRRPDCQPSAREALDLARAACAELTPATAQLVAIGRRALAANKDDRYPSVQAFRHEVERVLCQLPCNDGSASRTTMKRALDAYTDARRSEGNHGAPDIAINPATGVAIDSAHHAPRARRPTAKAPTMASEQTLPALLGSIWLFSDLTDAELTELARVTQRRKLAEDAVVVRQGETDGDLYVVVDGLLRVSVHARDERQLALNLLRRGDVCGELSLLDGRARSATITAVQPSDLLVIHRADFLELVARAPAMTMRLLQSMAAHVRRLTERVEDLSALPVRTRLAKKLLELADICGTQLTGNQVALPPSLSQQELADHIQATRESVNKCLTGWVREGIVYRTHSQIVINDRSRLMGVTGQS